FFGPSYIPSLIIIKISPDFNFSLFDSKSTCSIIPIGKLLPSIGIISLPLLIKLGDEPIFKQLNVALCKLIIAKSSVAKISSVVRRPSIELIDLMATCSEMPVFKICSNKRNVSTLSSRALIPFPIPALIARANFPLPNSIIVNASPDTNPPPFAADAAPVLTSKRFADPNVRKLTPFGNGDISSSVTIIVSFKITVNTGQSTSLLLHDIHEKREPFLYLYFLFPTGRYRVFLFEFACFSKHVLFVILVDHAALFLGQSHLQNCPSRLKPLSIDRLLFFYFHLPAFLAFY